VVKACAGGVVAGLRRVCGSLPLDPAAPLVGNGRPSQQCQGVGSSCGVMTQVTRPGWYFDESLAFPSPADDTTLVVVRFGIEVNDQAPKLSEMDEITQGIKAADAAGGGNGKQVEGSRPRGRLMGSGNDGRSHHRPVIRR
jgi:hypothetical protein